MAKRFNISPEAAVFSEHILDVFGAQFRFNHPKGLAEWVKNSFDAYQVERTWDDRQHVIVRVRLGRPKRNSIFEVIDFVGMTSEDIEDAFKRWGDPEAAAKGTAAKTLGGHGNGGKFYMREMFEEAHFITYRNGLLNVYGFVNKRYGYAKGYRDRPMMPGEAKKFAGIDRLELPASVRKRKGKQVRFTVVRGVRPKKWGGRSTVEALVRDFKYRPQVRRLLRTRPIYLVPGDGRQPKLLESEEIPPLPGFKRGLSAVVPRRLPDPESGDMVDMTLKGKYKPGLLSIETSQEALRGAQLGPLNCMDIRSEVRVLASYPMSELVSYGGDFVANVAQTEFLYGDCLCEAIDDRDVPSDEVCVSNDRERLIEAPRSRALLHWIKDRVADFAAAIASKEEREKRQEQLTTSSALNRFLNRWKNRFMEKVYAEVWTGPFLTRRDDEPEGRRKKRRKKKEEEKAKEQVQAAASDELKVRRPRYYEVLLSNHDPDPLSRDGKVIRLTAQHPPIYQRSQDMANDIYWLNTQTPLADAIIERYDVDSAQWRDYLFQRHVDIIVARAIGDLPAHGTDLTFQAITNIRDEITMRIFQMAATDLESFLFR